MSFSIGIVGLPNVGKSTLFRALTKNKIDIANYPFCTIEPNKGVVPVPDERLDKLAKLSKSEKVLNTTIEFVDIAGLVKGAHKGEGLGNQFLHNIREVDAICHVLRDFHTGDIVHVDGKVDPLHDAEVIDIELAFADLEAVNKHLSKLKDSLKGVSVSEQKETKKIIAVLEEKIIPALEEGRPVRNLELSDEESEQIKYLNLLTEKPMIYLLNVDEEKVGQKVQVKGLENRAVIPVCAKVESDLADFSEKEAQDYLKELGLEKSGLDKIILKSYEMLDLISFLTTGPKETKAWTIKRGTKAPQAAGQIHGDFEKGFIAVQVINWHDLVEAGSEAIAKQNGLIRLEGKDYIMQDGDTCEFRFNV
ncbi:MAG TPA: redox-regulated ATPase YchF [Patescibacteria group bacterium]|nr:redox-regulated ATPase YchF [Patescibacteria group bacterium]